MRSRRTWVIFLIVIMLAVATTSQIVDGPQPTATAAGTR